MLLHVVDASRDPERQIEAVQSVLNDIGYADKPSVVALNKRDLLTEVELDKLRGRFPDAIFCSAESGEGLDDLLERLSRELSRLRVEVSLDVPFNRGDVVAKVHEDGDVLQETYGENGTHLVARVPRETLETLGGFLSEVRD